jgi:hypothetical protein
MPAIRTVISDLYHSHIQGVRKNLFHGNPDNQTVISLQQRIQYSSTPVVVAIDGAVVPFFLTAPKAAVGSVPNGTYLFFEDAWSTVADITRASRIAVGGNYAGCLYSVFDTGGGTYKCVHTARPGGAKREESVALLAQHAIQQGWRLVHTVPTAGFVGIGGCDMLYIVTRVSYTVAPRPMVRTARLQIDQASRIVHCDRFQDA